MTETPLPTLTDLWAMLGDRAGDEVVALFDQLRDAGATDTELARALSMLITAQNLHAGAFGEALARNQLTAWDPEAVPPTVPVTEVATHLDRDRLARAVGTVLERIDPAELVATAAAAGLALHRLARSEAVETGQASFRVAMVGSDLVDGWERELEPDACELCHYWHDEGIQPKGAPMPTHKGCTCAQQFHRA